MKIIIGVLIIFFIAGSALAYTSIEYTLDGDWVYEEGYPGTLNLSENPSGGIIATIQVPAGLDDSGLSASRHELPGFSLDHNIFIELEYSSLTFTINDPAASMDIALEVEFFDSNFNDYEIGMAISLSNDTMVFGTWFQDDVNFEYSYEVSIEGTSINEGSLGLYFHGNHVSAYFKDAENNIEYPFPIDWDISQIAGAHDFWVDNDFEADTSEVEEKFDNGTIVLASVNLERVVFKIIKGDFDKDGNVDGADLASYINDPGDIGLGDFALNFGGLGPF
jgi:hypothetical protein